MKDGHVRSSIFGSRAQQSPVHVEAHDAAEVAPTGRGERRRREEERQRADRRRRRRRRRVRGTRRMIVLLVALGLVVGTGAVAVSVLWPFCLLYTSPSPRD